MARLRRCLTALVLLAPPVACAPPPPVRSLAIAQAPEPAISDPGRGELRTTLSVLTYNVEGLAWPARKGRAASLREIGRRLADLRRQGLAPDVVMFQEMLSGAAKRAVAATGYPAIVAGPQRLTFAGRSTDEPLPGRSRAKRGRSA